MLKQESIEALETRLGLEKGSLATAIGSEDEQEITIPDGKFFTDTDIETLKTNVIKENKFTYEDGKKAGVEMDVKAIKRELGYDFEGKDIKSLLEYHGTKIEQDAGKEPTAKVKELKTDLEKLQETYKTDKQAWETEKTTLANQLTNVQTNSKLSKHLDGLPKGLTRQDGISIFRNNYDIKNEDGVDVFYKDGKKLTDTLQNPLDAETIIKQFKSERGWGETPGRGGMSGAPSGDFKSMNEVMKHLDENKIDPVSSEGMKIINDFEAGQS